MEHPHPDTPAGHSDLARRAHHGPGRRARGLRPPLSERPDCRGGGTRRRPGSAGRMNRFLLPLGAFVLLVVVLAIGIRHAPEKDIIASPLIGKPAPQFSLPALAPTPRTVQSAELKGRWYLFNVWGTWCVEC